MKTYTVNEVRVNLGNIMETLFTHQFHASYSRSIEKYSLYIPELMTANQEAIDSLVNSIAAVLRSPLEIESIISKTSDVLLICFFMRYHLLTGYLCGQPQNKTISLPECNHDFFITLLNDAYLYGLSK